MGFTGDQVYALGTTELPFTIGEYPRKASIFVKFSVLKGKSSYNTIIG